MNRPLRHNLVALTSAVIALMAMLFAVSATVAVAAPGPGPGMAAMNQSGDRPCDRGGPACADDCAVLCHGLLAGPPPLAPPVFHRGPIRQQRAAALRSLSVEAEDPPPR